MIPRPVAIAGVILALFLILYTLAVLACCGDPCANHGGTVDINKGIFLCADGTAV